MPKISLDAKKRKYSNTKLKITEKVSFNIASEASYVYFLSGQKFIKKAKNCPIWRVLKNWPDFCVLRC